MLPIEKDTDETMRKIAESLKRYIGESEYGFMVLVFPFEDDVRAAHYISNCRRADMIKALREKADVLEKKTDLPISGRAN